MRLFHFSDDGGIEVFEPRPVRTPATRSPGMEWLNGPLVWAIQESHQPMYLFPRECPRILLWSMPTTTAEDRAAWWKGSSSRVIAYAEEDWRDRIRAGRLYRYEFPLAPFEDLDDAGMWVAREAVKPLDVQPVDDLMGEMAACDVELRLVPRLSLLRDVWSTSLHASGIRLRNAQDWARS